MRRAFALAFVLISTFACGWSERDDVLVLARRGDATSRTIAFAYAEVRSIPEERILELSLSIDPRSWVIEGEAYRREIADPIERYLQLNDPDGDVRTLVTVRGLPLLVRDCAEDAPLSCREGALDAALSQLGRTDEGRALRPAPNPYFGSTEDIDDFIEDHPEAPLRFLVARVTASKDAAPSSESASQKDHLPRGVARLLDATELDEASDGLAWCIVAESMRKSRTLAASLLLDPLARLSLPEGHTIREGCNEESAPGPVGGVVLPGPLARKSQTPGPLATPGIVLSLGGSRAGHKRTPKPAPFERLVDGWIERGAHSISLHLRDPTLANVLRPSRVIEAWASGATAAEAHYRGVPTLGGTHVLVGDPLLRIDADGAATNDRDGDGRPDESDNCPLVPNPAQRDTDGDGYGNWCDADVNDDGLVSSSSGSIYPLDERGDLERITLTARNGSYDPDHDLNGDGRVDERDLVIAGYALGQPPGR